MQSDQWGGAVISVVKCSQISGIEQSDQWYVVQSDQISGTVHSDPWFSAVNSVV